MGYSKELWPLDDQNGSDGDGEAVGEDNEEEREEGGGVKERRDMRRK